MFCRNFELNESVGPDQTPRSPASDLGLHCLPMYLFGTLGYGLCVFDP